MSWRENYYKGVASLDGLDVQMMPGDADAIDKALALMDASLAEAKKIAADNSSILARAKAMATGVDVGTIQAEVDTFAKAADSMHSTGARLKADPATTHERVVDFINGVKEIANISALKDSANYNKLSTLASQVGNQTLVDLGNKAKSVSASIWDAIPIGGKIGLGVGLVGIVWWKFLR